MKTALFTLLLGLCIVDPALAQETRDWSGDEIRGIHYAVPRNALLPDRWQAELQHTDDCQVPCTVEFDDRMSTVYLRYKWMQVNPQKGVYDFSNLGAAIDVVAAAGKPVSLIVMAGQYTPPWLFKNGVGHLQTRYHEKDEFSQERVPLVWERGYIDAHGEMIAELAKFLRETGRYDTITLVKNGALTTHSGETRLMPPKAFMKRAETDDPKKVEPFRAALCADYARAGYSETKIRQTALETTAQIATAFPDKYVGLAFVAGSRRFPTVDAAGRCSDPARNDTLDLVIKDMVSAYGPRAVVNSTVLTGKAGAPPILDWVRAQGGFVGFQLNAQAVGCRKPNAPCNAPDLEAAFRHGLAAGAIFIEAHDGNIHHYRNQLTGMNRILQTR